MTNKLHDPFFRKALENPLVAKEFFDSHLPLHIKKLVDLDSLQVEKESFVEPNLKRSISDVLFTVNSRGVGGYLYLLLEHQSTVDMLMAFRLFKYMLAICDRHLSINPDSNKLPLIYPILFYNARQPHKASKNLWDLFENSNLSKEIWTGDHQLVNVHDIPDEELKKKVWAGTMQFFMKHIFKRDLASRWSEVADSLPKIAEVNIGYDFIEILLAYTLPHIDKKDKIILQETLNKQLGKKGGELMTSLAQHWHDEGKLEGKLEGIAEGISKGRAEGRTDGKIAEKKAIATTMLKAGVELDSIVRFTGLSRDEIVKLKNEMGFKA